MLRVQYISDVHLEHRGRHIPTEMIEVRASTLVLAGDIGRVTSSPFARLLDWACAHFQDTLFVLGNHEHYEGVVDDTCVRARDVLDSYERVHWLDRSTWEHPSGVQFAGATLWSDITEPAFHRVCDGKSIWWTRDHRLSCDHYLALHRRDRAFFDHAIAAAARTDTPLVCVSHHAPLLEMNGAFGDSPVRSAFCSDLAPLFREPVRAWICGHTHQNVQHRCNDIPCVSNCLGYPSELGLFPGFRKDAVIEVGVGLPKKSRKQV